MLIIRSLFFASCFQMLTIFQATAQIMPVGAVTGVQPEFKTYQKSKVFAATDWLGQLKDGDIILAFGGTGFSTIITEGIDGGGEFSHAALVRKRGTKFITIESQPHTGTKSFDISQFKKENYPHFLVLRIKQRHSQDYAKLASDFAYFWSEQKVAYDRALDHGSVASLYCMELVVAAYSKAFGTKDSEVSGQSFIKNHFPVYMPNERLYNDIGFPVKPVLTANSIIRSNLFDVIYEHKEEAKALVNQARKKIMRHIVSLYDNGYTIKANPKFAILGMLLNNFTKELSLQLTKAYAIKDHFGQNAFEKIATLEKDIFFPLIKRFNKEGDIDEVYLGQFVQNHFEVSPQKGRRLNASRGIL